MTKIYLESTYLSDDAWVEKGDKVFPLELKDLLGAKKAIQFAINEKLYRDLGKPPYKIQDIYCQSKEPQRVLLQLIGKNKNQKHLIKEYFKKFN